MLNPRKSKGSKSSASGRKTGPIIRIAVGGIALGVAVMILSVAILTGFQNEIRSKVIGFGSHILITQFQGDSGFETAPISTDQDFYPAVDSLPEVANIQVFAQKAGILKTDEDIMGVVLKGIGSDYDPTFFNRYLQEGSFLNASGDKPSDSLVISRHCADKMNLTLGDKLIIYFIQNNRPRPRRFFVSGIYETGLEGFDDLIALGDIRHIQKINKWDPDQVGGFEINLRSFEDLDKADEIIYRSIPFTLQSSTIKQRHSDIFSWLELQDINVIIIISLMVLVCGINMTSALLIMILDRTRMIGVLKAMGAENILIRKVFLYHAAYLIGIGLLAGNILGLGLAYLQLKTGWIALPQETYYIDRVPINLEWTHLIALNLGTLLLCIAMLLLPSRLITRISPVKAIRFD